MCLLTKERKTIASEDIVCFKEGGFSHNEDRFRSDMQYYWYDKGEVAPFIDVQSSRCYDNADYQEVAQGYHAWSNPLCGNAVFVIPKGSAIYKGIQSYGIVKRGMVASSIVFIEKANFWKRLAYKLGIKTPKYVKKKEEI